MRRLTLFFYQRVVVSLLLALVLQGCATYTDGISDAVDAFDRGDFQRSESALKGALDPDGRDRLLYFMELGVVKHLQQDYVTSNGLLNQAEEIASLLETKSVSGKLGVLMSNPRAGPYRGTAHEKVLINYYKAMNYFGLAQKAKTKNDRLDALEGARIEARRMLIRLNDLNSQLGTYAEIKQKEKGTFSRMLSVLEELSGGLDKETLVYRDDAFAHYLIGLTFEMNAEYDDARISYQKAAQSYEEGYATQYRLGAQMVTQAWFDCLRMMRLAGGFENEWPQLANDKLSDAKRLELDQWIENSRDQGELVVIEHKGRVPPAQELNINVRASSVSRSLILTPSCDHNYNPCPWFYNLYSDKGLYKLGVGILDGVLTPEFYSPYTKTIWLGPAWNDFVELGMAGALGGWMRVTAPFYEPLKKPGLSTLRVSGQSYSLYEAASPAQMAVQQAMLTADEELQASIARAVTKSVAVSSLSSVAKKSDDDRGPLLGLVVDIAGSIASAASEAAETRSWLLLPYDIRIQRVQLPAGEWQAQLNSRLNPNQSLRSDTELTVKPGEIHLWQVRSLAGQAAATPKRQLATAPAEQKDAGNRKQATQEEERR